MTGGRSQQGVSRATAAMWIGVAAIAMARAAGAQSWDVGQVDQPGQATIYNRTAGSATIGFPLAGGDVNGDGRADLVLTPMNADSGPNRERRSAGEVVILFSDGTIGGERDLSALDVTAVPPDVMIVYGADRYDYLGTQVTTADIDGDGYADAIVGAQYADGPDNARPSAGGVAIIWGGPDLGGRVVDLRVPEPAGAVTLVHGRDAGDRLGVWVGAGDFDGDGRTDAILGADQADGPAGDRPHAGETYVLYGGAALRSVAAVDLAATPLPLTVAYGIDPEDHSGSTVRGADLDGDGAAELLIGAGLNRLSNQTGPNGGLDGHGFAGGDGRDNACDPVDFDCQIGEAYVVYGERGERPAVIDLADPPASTVFIYGIDPGDAYGEELFAGDFNGDGYRDVAIGAITADGPANLRSNAGELALVSGGPSLRGSVIELASPPANVTIFSGANTSAIAGDTAMFLDVDGDGKDELVIAAPNDRPRNRVQAGRVFVFFGTDAALPARVDLAAIPPELAVLRIDGADPGDMLAYSVGQGDVDGDGLRDMILNAMGGDGFGNLLEQAGDAYVLDSVVVSHVAGRLPTPTPTATGTVTPTPTPTRPPCGGDCNADGQVTINELITGVRIALGDAPLAMCPVFDRAGDGAVDITDLVAAVMNSLEGCRSSLPPQATSPSAFPGRLREGEERQRASSRREEI